MQSMDAGISPTESNFVCKDVKSIATKAISDQPSRECQDKIPVHINVENISNLEQHPCVAETRHVFICNYYYVLLSCLSHGWCIIAMALISRILANHVSK